MIPALHHWQFHHSGGWGSNQRSSFFSINFNQQSALKDWVELIGTLGRKWWNCLVTVKEKKAGQSQTWLMGFKRVNFYGWLFTPPSPGHGVPKWKTKGSAPNADCLVFFLITINDLDKLLHINIEEDIKQEENLEDWIWISRLINRLSGWSETNTTDFNLKI